MRKELPAELYPLTNQRRELMLRIYDGHKSVHAIMQPLYFLDQHFPPDKTDRALAWLILNHHTGAGFVRWFTEECQSSNLEMHRKLLQVIENKDKERLIAGRNFRV